MKEILVDFDVIKEYLKTGKGILPEIYEKYKMKIALTTLIEVFSSVTFIDLEIKNQVDDFVKKYFEVIEINIDIANKASELIRTGQTFDIISSINSAIALIFDFEIAVLDKERYKKVENLRTWSV